MSNDTDVIIVGAGLAGLVTAAELIDAGRRVIVLDQEPEASFVVCGKACNGVGNAALPAPCHRTYNKQRRG